MVECCSDVCPDPWLSKMPSSFIQVCSNSYNILNTETCYTLEITDHTFAPSQSAKAAVTVGEKAQRLFLDPHLSRVAGLTQQRKTLNAYASNASESVGIRGLNLESIQTESEVNLKIFLHKFRIVFV